MLYKLQFDRLPDHMTIVIGCNTGHLIGNLSCQPPVIARDSFDSSVSELGVRSKCAISTETLAMDTYVRHIGIKAHLLCCHTYVVSKR